MLIVVSLWEQYPVARFVMPWRRDERLLRLFDAAAVPPVTARLAGPPR